MESLISLMITIFMVLDPLGNIPIINSMLSSFKAAQRKKIIIRESIFALIFMLIFLFFGSSILKLIGVEQESMSMAGGVVLFLIGLSMTFPSEGKGIDSSDKEPFLVPLAIPLIAGPGVLSMLMLVRHKNGLTDSIIAVLGAWSASLIILLLSSIITKVLGSRGTEACKRLMGLVLTAMAVNMFMTGLRAFMKG